MSPLSAPQRTAPSGSFGALFLATLLIAASFTGCIGNDDGSEEAGFKVFIAAVGEVDQASAGVGTIRVSLEGSDATQQLTTQRSNVDLVPLASNGTAVLVANGPGLNGTAQETVINLDYVSVGSVNETSVRVSLDEPHPVGESIEATLTVDLEATADAGEARLHSYTVDQGGQRLLEQTGSDLPRSGSGTNTTTIPPLPPPRIIATSDTNDTAPSFVVNSDINFTYTLPPSEASVRQSFWAFGDDRTDTGQAVTHAYREPGLYRVRAILEGEQGQQSTGNATIDAYLTIEGEGNVGIGTGGLGAIEGRDTKNHTFEIPGNFTSISIRTNQSPSGGLCQGDECAPSNVHFELYDPNDQLLAENSSDNQVKWLNVSGLLDGGNWTLRVKGDEGAAVGYSFEVEAHYLGLCAEAGGLPEFDCPAEPEPVS